MASNTKLTDFKSLVPIIALIICVTLLILSVNLYEIENIEEAAEIFKQSDPSMSKTTNYSAPNQANPMRPVINEVTGDNKTDQETNMWERIVEGLMFGGMLIAVAVPSAFGIYMLYKHRKRVTLKLFFSIAFSIVSCATTFLIIYFFYWMFLSWKFNIPYSDLYTFSIGGPLALVIGIGIIYGITSKRTRTKIRVRNSCLLVLSGLVAAFLVMVLPAFALIVIIVLLIIWDIYATRSGPIKKIIDIIDEDEAAAKKARRDELRAAQQAALQAQQTVTPGAPPSPTTHQVVNTPAPAAPMVSRASTSSPPVTPAQKTTAAPSTPAVIPPKKEDDMEVLTLFGLYDTDKFSIGIGDLIFYSVFTALAMRYFLFWLPFYGFYNSVLGILIPLYVAVFIGVAVLAGFLKTVQLLEKNYVLPGLPISMGIGLICFFVILIILEVINKIFYGNFVPIF